MRPENIEDIMLRSAIWECSIHHWEKPGYKHTTEPVEPTSPVKNKDCAPSNGSRAAHDRMELVRYILELEGEVRNYRRLYGKTLYELHKLETAF